MGMFDHLTVERGVDLPHFPDSIDASEIGWQTKSFHSGLDKFKLTADGRLLRREISHREKTDEEKQSEAEKWGFESWESYTTAYDEFDISDEGVFPDAVEGEITFDDGTDNPPHFSPSKTVVDERWWADHNQHGSFEFHASIRQDPIEYETVEGPDGTVERPSEYALDVFLSYEARFTKGECDEIVLLGERGSTESGDCAELIEELEEYDEQR